MKKQLTLFSILVAGVILTGAVFSVAEQTFGSSEGAHSVEVAALPAGADVFVSGFVTPASCSVYDSCVSTTVTCSGGENPVCTTQCVGGYVNQAHPEYGGACSPQQCQDGADNDGDGNVDAADAGCHTDNNPSNPYVPTDTTEAGEPPPQLPTATISADPASIVSGSASTLTWSSTDATSCISPGTASYAPSGTQSVSPTTTRTYSLTCTGAGGTSAPASATVTVTAPPQCSDGIDNADPEDILVDLADPGCTDPNDNDETDLQPNLTSENLRRISGTLQSGRTVRFRANVRNNGTAATPRSFSDEFAYQWNGTGGAWTPWRVIQKSALSQGASSQDTSNNLTLSAPNPGTQNIYIQHCIDSTLRIDESDETVADNCSVIGPLAVSPAPACSDGFDNDGDGNTDANDGGCHSDSNPGNPGSYVPTDNNEAGEVLPQCGDGIDNDGDGLTDRNDPSCHTDGNVNNPGSYLSTISSEDDVSIAASPIIVRSGDTSIVSWQAGGTPTSCSISGPGVSETTTIGAASTGVITEQRTYTISCDYGGFERSASVTIIVLPSFEEF